MRTILKTNEYDPRVEKRRRWVVARNERTTQIDPSTTDATADFSTTAIHLKKIARMASTKHAGTVEDLMDSLESLEDVLEPLLSSPLPDTLAKLNVLERAKMQATLAYVTQDLVFSGSSKYTCKANRANAA